MSHDTTDTTDKTTIQSLPEDIFNRILGMVPQLALTNKAAYKLLPPKSVLSEHFGIRFPSLNSNPDDLIEISHSGITFSYHVPKNRACNWDGMDPYPHGVAGRHIYTCDFCEKIDDKTAIVGNHYMGGVLFVGPKCNEGLTYRLTQIMGPHLWKLVDAMQQIMVPRSNGPNEMWFLSSKLPTIHRGEWHLHVQSCCSLVDENCLNKVVSVKKLQELNKA
jgi:hypothetical protein